MDQPQQDPRHAPLTVSLALSIITAAALVIGTVWAVAGGFSGAVERAAAGAVAQHEGRELVKAHGGMAQVARDMAKGADTLVDIRIELRGLRTTLDALVVSGKPPHGR